MAVAFLHSMAAFSPFEMATRIATPCFIATTSFVFMFAYARYAAPSIVDEELRYVTVASSAAPTFICAVDDFSILIIVSITSGSFEMAALTRISFCRKQAEALPTFSMASTSALIVVAHASAALSIIYGTPAYFRELTPDFSPAKDATNSRVIHVKRKTGTLASAAAEPKTIVRKEIAGQPYERAVLPVSFSADASFSVPATLYISI